jgi:hypothetical protein
MTVPDVRVRLSAAGTDEIIRAFKNVEAAAQKSGKTGAQGIKLLNSALGELKAMLPAIGLGAAVMGIGILVKNALESADAIGKLSQKVGMSSETLSVLAYGATKTGVEFDKFTKGLGLFNKTMANLDHGNAAAAASVRRLLGDSAALNGLDTEQRFMKVVDALAKMPAGYEKTRAAQEFFGKSGMELIPMLDQLGEGGFARLMKRAQELGLVMSTEMTAAAMRASESLKDIKAEAQGAATQFVTGLAPGLSQTADALVKITMSTHDGKTGMQQFGEATATAFNAIVKGALIAQNVLRYFVDILGTANMGSPFASMAAAYVAYAARSAEIQKQFAPPILIYGPTAAQLKKPTAEGGSAPNDTLMKGQVAALKAGLADQLALYKAQDELLAAQQQRAYDDGKLSIAAYFADRATAIRKGSAKEIAALQQERTAIAKAPIVEAGKSSDQIGAERLAQKTELHAIDTKIAIATLDEQKKLEENTDKQGKAEGALDQHRLDAEKQIQLAQGDTYAAAIAGIQKQAAAYAGAHVAQAKIDQYVAAETAKARIVDLEKQGGFAMGALSDVHAGLQTDVAKGDLFPFQELQQYDQAVQAALPHLRDFAAQELAAATALGDPAAIQKAHQFSDSIEQLAATSSMASQQLAKIKSGIESGLQGAFTNFFSTGIDQAHTFGAAMQTLALDVVRSLQQIAAQMLATLATQKLLGSGASGGSGGGLLGGLLGLFGLGKSAGAASSAIPAFGMGADFAEGGFITGPGTGTSDSIPAMLSNREYVVNARSVARPGNLAILEQLNRGMQWPAFRTPGSYRTGYAEGGLVTPGAALGSGGGGSNAAHVIVSLSEGLVADHIESGPGSRAVIRTIGDNRNAVKAALGVK